MKSVVSSFVLQVEAHPREQFKALLGKHYRTEDEMTYKTDRIFVANHQSVVGSAIVRRLTQLGHPRSHIVSCSPGQVCWQSYSSIRAFFAEEKPDQVYLWGMSDILTTSGPGKYADPFSDGIRQEPVGTAHIVEAAFRSGIRKLINVATDAELGEVNGYSLGTR